MINLSSCPITLSPGFTEYSPRGLKNLFDGRKVSYKLDFDIDEFTTSVEISDAMHRISVSGVQEKFPAIIENGSIRIAPDNVRSTFILKPAPWDKTLRDRAFIPANEHLTMQIASQVYGITTAANGLCFTSKGRPVYITRRFDILADGLKLPMEDFATLAERSSNVSQSMFKYSGSYELIGKIIKQFVPAYKVEIERLFELVVFNYIFGNGDAHLKNFAILRKGKDYRLAPAYDLLNTSLHIEGYDFALSDGLSKDIEKSDIYAQTGHPCRTDFERFGAALEIGQRRLAHILDKYIQLWPAVLELTRHSFLPDKLKRSYLRIVNERITRFIRLSE